MNQDETTQILNELLSSIKHRGFRKTLNLLKNNQRKYVEINDPLDIFIIKTICEGFDITQDELLHGKYLRGENKYAIGLCVYFLYENKSLGEIHKQVFVNKNKTLLSKYRQLIFDLKPSNREDNKILTIKSTLENIIENFKKNNQ